MNKINKLLYLGPQGSYSDIAKNKFLSFCSSDCEFVSTDSIYRIVRDLKNIDSESVAAVVPLENSIEGIVRETQDNLLTLADKGFRVFAETTLAIEHSLIGYGSKSQITTITSHSQALAQCREYILKNFSDEVVLNPVLSTSNAVKSLEQDNFTVAAIGSAYSAKLYGTPIIESRINDENNNTTRFILLSKLVPQKSDINKISLVFSTENTSGALNKVLNIFEKYNLNLSYIDSRPSRRELGEYVFYVDFAGHIDDSCVTLALMDVQPYVKMLGILSQGAICVEM